MGQRLIVLALLAVAVPTAAASAASARPASLPNWAGPQIRMVVAQGLFGQTKAATFHPNDALTRQTLANLAFGLQQALVPPVVAPPTTTPLPTDPTATDQTVTDPASTDATATEPAPTEPTATEPAPSEPAPVGGDVGTTTDPTATEPAPTEPPADSGPTAPPKVSRPDASASMSALDARLVASLGLTHAADEFAKGAKAAGLSVPSRFGTEVAARLLGLRTNHPAAQDFLELRPQDPATRAEAAYSAAQILGFGWLGNSWQTAAVQSLADSFELPALSPWQTRILDVAFSKIGMPYIWGGTSDGTEAPFGVRSRGGYDCSGFVWRVYKLQSYPGERGLASTLRGRTTYQMSVEVPRSQLIPFAKLQPADVIFFGDRGPNSSSAEVGHMGIYVGNGWFIHSSGYGVALAQLTGWYRHEFAWGRRPLREAGLG
ncbi:MAG TPA: NlpC/P60 family protein [Gaiellaceae bacterium]|nr:NlpC/P60 family protein [Gaiellaceae bacterium]